MEILLITFIVMTLAVLGMAVGVLLGRSPIKGTCGGLNNIPGISCECADPCEKRKKAIELASRDALNR
jgi:hypothetical protein